MYMLALDKDEDGDIEFQFNQRRGSWYGKPVFPESTESYDIIDYIGPDSIGFFYNQWFGCGLPRGKCGHLGGP